MATNLDFFGFFDYVEGVSDDTYEYTSEEFSDILKTIAGTGIFKGEGNEFATELSGDTVLVKTGSVFIKGRYGRTTVNKSITLDAVETGYKRIDRVVIRLDKVNRVIAFDVVKGTPTTGTAVAPDVTRTDTVYELSLCKANVVSGSTTTLTDERSDDSVCGFIDSVEDIGILAKAAVPKTDIVNNLTTNDSSKVLSAAQGKALNDMSLSGWIPANETWTYASVDNPIGIITVSGDVTGKYSGGMRIKFVNGGNAIHGIIVATPTYSAPNTTITFLHRINPATNQALYLMANSAITENYYSTSKAPYGFTVNPANWTLKVVSVGSVATPTASTSFQQFGALQLTLPIGIWNLSVTGDVNVSHPNAGSTGCTVALSTSTSGITDDDFKRFFFQYSPTIATMNFHAPVTIQGVVALSAKTIYYLIGSCYLAGVSTLIMAGGLEKTILKAICAFL